MFIKFSDSKMIDIAVTEARIMMLDSNTKIIHRYYDPVANIYEMVADVLPELVVVLLLLGWQGMVEVTITGFCCATNDVSNLLEFESIIKKASGENPFMMTQEEHFLAYVGKVVEPLADYPQFATVYK